MQKPTISRGELRDIAILAYCYGLINVFSNDTFISEEYTKQLKGLMNKLLVTINRYSKHKAEINKKVKTLSKAIEQIPIDKKDCLHLLLFSLTLLYFNFQNNERKNKILSENLKAMWKVSRQDVLDLWYAFSDLKNVEDVCIYTEEFTYKVLEKVR